MLLSPAGKEEEEERGTQHRGRGGAAAAAANKMVDKMAKRVLPVHILDEEFGLVKEAFFTEPEDSSAWLYHSWLVAHLAQHYGGEVTEKRLAEEISTCREVLQVEPECKWPLLILARLLETKAALCSQHKGKGGERER